MNDTPTVAEIKKLDTIIDDLIKARKAKSSLDLVLFLMAAGDKFRQLETNLNFRMMF